jgi:hypothetical protein
MRKRRYQFVDRIGQRFGKMEVIGIDVEKSQEELWWKCRCDCGRETSFALKNLYNPKRVGCGQCGRKLMAHGEAAFNVMLGQYKHGAKVRGLEFSLTTEQFRALTQLPCFYCGVPPKKEWIAKNQSKKGTTNGSYLCNGIDRVDNSLGYTSENCVPCCTPCNKAKMDRTQQEFLEWIDRLVKHRMEVVHVIDGDTI